MKLVRVLTIIVLVALGGVGRGGVVQAGRSAVGRCLWPIGGIAPVLRRAWCVQVTPTPGHPAAAANSQAGGSQFTTIDDPLTAPGNTFATGLNDRGEIVGG